MRRAMLVAAIAAFATACTVTGNVEPTISPPPPTDVDGSPTTTPTPPARADPRPREPALDRGGDARPVRRPHADGDALDPRERPWAPPPASMNLAWASGGRELRLLGTSFVSLAVTSADHVLSFSVQGPNGPLEFSSADGGCSITITPALPNNMGGLFDCAAITDVEGGTTVGARGTFAATG